MSRQSKVSRNKKKMLQNIGRFLKSERERAGFTQQVVADKAGLTTAQYVSNVERGISPPSIEFLQITTRLYNSDPEQVAFYLSRAYHDFYLSELSSKAETVVRKMHGESSADIESSESEFDVIEPEYKRVA